MGYKKVAVALNWDRSQNRPSPAQKERDILVHWGISFIVMSAIASWRWSKSFPVVYPLTFFYLVNLANAVLCFRVLSAWDLNPAQLTYLLSTGSFAVFILVLFAIGTIYIPKPQMILRNMLCVYGIVGSIISIFFGWKIIPHISSNETLIAVGVVYFLPSFSDDLNWTGTVIALAMMISVIFSNTSSPIGVLCVVIASYLIMTKQYKLLHLAVIPLIIGILYYTPSYLFSDTMRFQAYKVFMSFWWRDSWWNVIFGYGPGSFEILSQLIQLKADFMLHRKPDGNLTGNLWMHMHSDLLQILWEYGVIGFGLIATCAAKLYQALRGKIQEQCILIGVLSAMLFDFPLRYPGVPLVFVLLFAIAFNEERYGERI